jgi:polyketide cyclase/dehydrase/lipid transport protein
MAQAENNSGPMDRLKAEAGGLVGALAERTMSSVRGKVESTTGRLTDYVEGDGGPGLMAAVTGAKSLAEGKSPGRSMLSAGWAGLKEKASGVFRGGKGKGSGRQKLKLTNIVESVEVGVPIRLAYNQWTTYRDFPSFTKKVENAEPNDDNTKVNWKAQVFWSHREWEATIIDQRPDERIIWRSKGQKGHVDGAVTFHELTPTLTKIVVVLEYHPQGLFERTGSLWRAQGRRVRLELKHFQRHVMAHTLLSPDDVEGWRGVIEDGKVVKDHETVLDETAQDERASEQGEEPVDAVEEEAADETEPADDEFSDEEPADEEAGVGAPAGEDADAAGDRPGDRRRAPARGGSRRSRQRTQVTEGIRQ